MATQSKERPGELWKTGVQAYLDNAATLLRELESGSGGKPAPAFGGAAKRSAPSRDDDGGVTKPASSLFGGDSKPAAPSLFGAPPAGGDKPSLFSFGGGASAVPAAGSVPPPLFSFGGSGAAPASGGSLFSAAPAPAPAAGGGDANDDDEAEEEEPEEVELGSSGDVEILSRAEVKMMALGDNKKWADRGAGTLTLRRSRAAGPSSKPFVVFTSSAGRVLVNAPLVKGMGPTCPPKTPCNMVMFLISSLPAAADGEAPKEERGMRLFKFASPEAMQGFKENILPHV